MSQPDAPTPSPSTPPRLLYYLHTASPLTPTDPTDLPKELNGHPVAYFWADGIHTGRYVHPAGHFELLVDRQRLDTWADNFRRMREAGVDVPVPVDHSPSARDNLGYVIDVRRDGDTLRLLHQLIGDDAIKLAARNKVSLGIDRNFTDGRGTPFGDCVVHSSLTPIPVVPGQAGFVPLAAGQPPAIIFHPAPPPPAAQHDHHLALLQRRIESLVAGAHVTPACADRLLELFRSRDRPSAPIQLSHGADFDAADAFLEALSHNRALPLGERTGLQTLSRLVPGEESAIDASIQSKMVRMANGQ
jgi:hypothetical protein